MIARIHSLIHAFMHNIV